MENDPDEDTGQREPSRSSTQDEDSVAVGTQDEAAKRERRSSGAAGREEEEKSSGRGSGQTNESGGPLNDKKESTNTRGSQEKQKRASQSTENDEKARLVGSLVQDKSSRRASLNQVNQMNDSGTADQKSNQQEDSKHESGRRASTERRGSYREVEKEKSDQRDSGPASRQSGASTPKNEQERSDRADSQEPKVEKRPSRKSDVASTPPESRASTQSDARQSKSKDESLSRDSKVQRPSEQKNPDAVNPVSHNMSMESISSPDIVDEDIVPPENIVWEWEEELDEYDEPDIYPSEKDYVMVPTLVEISDDEISEVDHEAEKVQAVDEAGAEEEEKKEGKTSGDTVELELLRGASKVPQSAEIHLVDPDRDEATPSDVSMVGASEKDDASQKEEEKVGEKKEEAIEMTEINLGEQREGKEESEQNVEGGEKGEKKENGEEKEKEGDADKVAWNGKAKEQVTTAEQLEGFGNVPVDVVKADIPKEKDETIRAKDETEEDDGKVEDFTPKMVGGDQVAPVDETDKGVEEKTVESPVKDVSEKLEGESLDFEKDAAGEKQLVPDRNLEIETEEKLQEAETQDKAGGGAKDESAEQVDNEEKPEIEKEIAEKGDKDGESNDVEEDQNKEIEERPKEEENGEKPNIDEEEEIENEEGKEEHATEKEKKEEEGEKKAKQEAEEKEEEERKAKEEEEKKTKVKAKGSKAETAAPDAASVGTTEDGIDQADEFDVPGFAEQEPEANEPPPKKYKTVMVKTLVPRPPKIHYVPEEERKTHTTSDKHLFRKHPFSLTMSYGYDCQRMANLHVLDKQTLVFMSGFVLTFFNHKTGEQSYLRCIGGSCFGALAIHPSRRLFAAAEKGDHPIVGIWSWPKLQLFRKLREGTNKAYASVNFSPCGRYLATQGGEPDYLITVYNWLAEMPVVRVKSHAQDVFRVTFSKELAGRLTTAGLCHIKFWKMATTFTGLKLKGDIGRFGRTELSDIEGYIEMPDGKVLSGTEWGNLLLWENGLIVAEICTRQDVACHEGIVRQVLLAENEFYTTGQDGWVRTWPFDAVDSAEINTSEESLKVPVKPLGQVLVKDNSDIWYIVQDIPDETSNSVYWFAQDGKGTIMRVDLSFLNTAKEPYPVLTAHGGPIVGCATSKINCIFATLGADGQIRVYDYIRHRLLASRTFSAPGTILLWPGVYFDPTCCTILAGFADGTVRVLVLSRSSPEGGHLPMSLFLLQVRKPHSRQVTCMDVDSTARYLATGGEDGTLFFFDIWNEYAPLMFIDMPDYKSVTALRWIKTENKENPEEDSPDKIFAGLHGGTLVEIMVPKIEDFDNTTTYHYMDPKFTRRVDFMSVKSELLHNEEVEMERLAEEQLNEAIEVENRKRVEEGLETASQQNIRLLEEAEEMERVKAELGPKKKWQPYIPLHKSPISLMIPSAIDPEEIFLSMGGYDAGYLYLMRFGEPDKNNPGKENPHEPVNATKIEDSKDQAVTAFAMTTEGDYIFLGFADGRIRVQNLEYPYALEHIDKHWTEGLHDCVRGKVTSISLDKDGVFIITAGQDGNCFLLSGLSDADLEEYVQAEALQPVSAAVKEDNVIDIIDPNFYTLEVFKRVEKEMALLAEAKKNKTAKREEIARLRIWYNDILKKNNELPEEFRLTHVELALTTDKEVRRKEEYEASLKQLNFETAWHTEKSKLALGKVQHFYKDVVAFELFELRAFNTETNVWSFRMPHLPPWFEEAKDKVMTHITPHSIDSDTFQEDVSPAISETVEKQSKPVRTPGMDKFVYQRLVRIWERKQKKIVRARVWKDFLRTEPKGKDLKEEDRAIEEARANMGDMKLKSAADYKVPESKKLTEHRGRNRLVKLEETMYAYRKEFNRQILQLRQEKVECLVRMNKYKTKIIESQSKLALGDIKTIPQFKAMVITENPHRTMEYTVEDVKEYKRQIEEKMKAAAPATKAVKKQEGPTVKRKGPNAAHQKPSIAPTKLTEKSSEHGIVPPEKNRSFGAYMEPFVNVLTPLEEQIQRAEILKAKFWQDHYIKKIEEEKLCFDARLKLLRHRKLKLDYLLKTADARMVLLTQEFILAQQSEALEASLETKIHDTSKEKRECTNIMKTVGKKLENVKKEMDAYGRQKQALLNEVIALAVSRAPAFEKYLVRVFSKKMPKVKSRASVAASMSNVDLDSDDDESSESSDDDMDLDEDEDDGLDVDFPPPELNKEVYDNVVEIREKRVKIDESEASTREQLEELTQLMNQYRQRVNLSDREYERGRRELDRFRKEKQEKQNVLNCAVSMKLHQIQDLGKELGHALVTENRNIDRLMHRIPELHKEKIRQRMTGMDMKKLNMQLHKEKVEFQKRLQRMHKDCDREMLRKFGQIRPVEELEFFTIDPRVATLKAELKGLEEQFVRELEEVDFQMVEAQRAKSHETMKSISKLNTVAHMSERVHMMNRDMEDQMKKLPSELEDTVVSREIAFLKVVLTDQWNTISALSLEIAQLTQRKHQPLPPIPRSGNGDY